MPRETEVGIIVDGKEVLVRLRCLTKKEVREIRKKAGMFYNAVIGKVDGDYLVYQDMCTEKAVVREGPAEKLDLDNIADPEFDKLIAAYKKVAQPSEEEKAFLPKP
jgi:hypothetical protein